MKALGYHKGFALGSIASSSCLGMLIPPNVLMIVWGILTEQSIGRLFLAGILPGFLLATLFLIYVIGTAIIWSQAAGEDRQEMPESVAVDDAPVPTGLTVFGSFFGIGFIIIGVLGGIWFGVFTPTEGAGAGAALALLFAFAKGMRRQGLLAAIFSVGKTAAPILILLLMAAFLFAHADNDRGHQRHSELLPGIGPVALFHPRPDGDGLVHPRHGDRLDLDHHLPGHRQLPARPAVLIFSKELSTCLPIG